MKLLSELPKTDLTAYKVDTFLNNANGDTAGAALYLLELCTSENYVDDLIGHSCISVDQYAEAAYKAIKDYYNLNIRIANLGSGSILQIMTTYTYDLLAGHIQRGSIILDITGHHYEEPKVPKVTISEDESVFLTEYMANKKIYTIPNQLEIALIQEYVAKYELSDENTYKLCKLVNVPDINKSYAILTDTRIPTISEILEDNVNPSHAITTISNEEDWKMLSILNNVLQHHIQEK